MKLELTEDEIQATLDAINRFKPNDPGLEKTYEIEFVITHTDSSTLNSIELFLNQNEIAFTELKTNASDIFLVMEMKLDKDRIIDIESSLTYFANKHGLKYDGWGAFE
jgi:regulator of RNase E activity RraB